MKKFYIAAPGGFVGQRYTFIADYNDEDGIAIGGDPNDCLELGFEEAMTVANKIEGSYIVSCETRECINPRTGKVEENSYVFS